MARISKVYTNCSFIFIKFIYVFWEGHTILQNLHQLFDWQYIEQIIGGDFAKFCGLLRLYELYQQRVCPQEILLQTNILGLDEFPNKLHNGSANHPIPSVRLFLPPHSKGIQWRPHSHYWLKIRIKTTIKVTIDWKAKLTINVLKIKFLAKSFWTGPKTSFLCCIWISLFEVNCSFQSNFAMIKYQTRVFNN